MELFSLPKIDSDLTAWFILDGKEYEMSQFSISFGQSVDHKTRVRDKDCVKNRVKRAKIVRFTLC